jgi:tetratricopeptide (TPR) repeat protein
MDLGIVYEKMGDLKKAEGAYRQAVTSPGTRGPRAELGVARILARMGDRAGAIRAYRSFLRDHPFGVERQDVIEALAQLGASAQADRPGASAQAAAPKPAIP